MKVRMNGRRMLWFVPGLIWIGFTLWYTDFGGPLSDDEIAEAVSYLESRKMEPRRIQTFRTFFENDTGRQFLMVNNIDINDAPPRMEGFGPDATSEDYMDHYMEHMYPELFARASHPVFYANGLGLNVDVSGIEGAEGWDTAALFRYRSRRTFVEIITNPAIGPRHEFKLAAMTKTIAYPVETVLYLSDPRFLIFLIFGFLVAITDSLVFGRRRDTSA
jgi:hypothetical protein